VSRRFIGTELLLFPKVTVILMFKSRLENQKCGRSRMPKKDTFSERHTFPLVITMTSSSYGCLHYTSS
jgi:hypothetical protein